MLLKNLFLRSYVLYLYRANGRDFLPFAFLMSKHSVRPQHSARPSMQHPETITRGKRWPGRLGILHRMGDDGKVGTECFCVWGVSPPSCAQVSGNMPFSLCHGHRVGFRHSDRGAMAETNPVPFLMSCRFFFVTSPRLGEVPDVAGQRWIRWTAPILKKGR